MNCQKFLLLTISLALVTLFLVACGESQASPTPEPEATSTPAPATSTPVPPTSTPVPPTVTPTATSAACEVKCEVDVGGNLSFEITCESGRVDQTHSISYEGGGIKATGQRTYQTSGNSYDFTAFIQAKEGAWKANIEVTGGVFGETAQVCESE